MIITIEVTEEREYLIDHDEEYCLPETLVWEMRNLIDPPRLGFVMHSSSGAEYNLEQLLEEGWRPEDLMVCTIAGNDTVWRYEGDKE
tara:strand:+ start:556 stop:816 length:261 start_codon:yes stop_codon:yes gene_type:complete